MVTELGVELGFQNATPDIKVELYKLLLYEKGGHVQGSSGVKSGPTKALDEADVLGQLRGDGWNVWDSRHLMCLPSKHSGGAVVLSRHGETRICRLQLSRDVLACGLDSEYKK